MYRMMAHDPQVYTRPMDFWPDRYLGEKPEQDPTEFVFGFGRRICPGRHVADASIWIAMAKVLSAFDVLRPSKDGKQYVPSIEMTPGLVRYDLLFA